MRFDLVGFALLAFAGCTEASAPGPNTGRVVWEVQASGRNVAPTLDSLTLYVASRAHEVLAIERTTGRVRWRASTSLQTPYTEGFNLVAAGRVVVLADAFLFAFDRSTGAPVWSFRPADGDQPGLITIATDGTTIYAPSYMDRVYAVNASDGTLRWMTQLEGDSVTAVMRPMYAAGRVFVGTKRFANPDSGAFLALDPADGRVLWRYAFTPAYPNALYGCLGYSVYGDGTVYVAAEDGRLYAFDASTGAVRWTAPYVHHLPPAIDGMYADTRPLALVGDVLVAGSLSGILVGLDARTGAERWRRAQPPIYPQGNPIAADTGAGVAYVTTTGGELYAIDAATGRELWRFGTPPTPDDLHWSVATTVLVAGDTLFASGYERYMALRKR